MDRRHLEKLIAAFLLDIGITSVQLRTEYISIISRFLIRHGIQYSKVTGEYYLKIDNPLTAKKKRKSYPKS